MGERLEFCLQQYRALLGQSVKRKWRQSLCLSPRTSSENFQLQSYRNIKSFIRHEFICCPWGNLRAVTYAGKEIDLTSSPGKDESVEGVQLKSNWLYVTEHLQLTPVKVTSLQSSKYTSSCVKPVIDLPAVPKNVNYNDALHIFHAINHNDEGFLRVHYSSGAMNYTLRQGINVKILKNGSRFGGHKLHFDLESPWLMSSQKVDACALGSKTHNNGMIPFNGWSLLCWSLSTIDSNRY